MSDNSQGKQSSQTEKNTPGQSKVKQTIAALRGLYDWLHNNDMKYKYMYKDADGNYKYTEKYNGNLDKADLNKLINGIVNAIKLSKETMNKNDMYGDGGSNISDEDEEKRIRAYLNKILTEYPYYSEQFNGIIDTFKIDSKKQNPYDFYSNRNKPNILTNIALYVKHPEMKPIVYQDDMLKGKSIENVLLKNKLNNAESNISEYMDNIMDLSGQLNDSFERIRELEKEGNDKTEELIKLENIRKSLMSQLSAAETEINNMRKFNKNIMPTINKFNQIKAGVEKLLGDSETQNAALGKLLERNRSRELDERANKFIGDKQPIKSRIDSIREQLAKERFDQNEINQIIAKALSKEEHYKRVVAANQDLFDRDMSPDTVQNENEQFQSKLRQQNLRYILPAFIERREKLVENTLNPNLLKGAFAI